MKKKLWIAFIIITFLFVSYKVYSWYSDKNNMEKTDIQLESLLQPFIDNTVVVIDEDKYFLRIKEAKISDHAEPYKKSLNDSAYITFDIYKNEVSEHNLIDTKGIHMEVCRTDLNSNFYTNGNGHIQDISYKGDIFDIFSDMIFDNLYMDIVKNELGRADEEYTSRRSHGSYNEDRIEFNNYGKVTSPGEAEYESITYAKDLSMKFTTAFYVEDFQKYNEMNIKIEKAEGDYHALWDIKADDIDKLTFYYDGNYEDMKTITYKHTIEKLVNYLKSIPFDILEDQQTEYEPCIYITLGENEHDVILSKDAIYTNSDYAVFKGEASVKELIQILEEGN